MTCKDCIHYEACKEKFAGLYEIMVEEPNKHLELNPNVEKRCLHFTNHSEWVHLPCKVGDTVYFLNDKSIIETTIDKIGVRQSGLFIKLAKNKVYETAISALGKTVFLTKEEAEKALKELDK